MVAPVTYHTTTAGYVVRYSLNAASNGAKVGRAYVHPGQTGHQTTAPPVPLPSGVSERLVD